MQRMETENESPHDDGSDAGNGGPQRTQLIALAVFAAVVVIAVVSVLVFTRSSDPEGGSNAPVAADTGEAPEEPETPEEPAEPEVSEEELAVIAEEAVPDLEGISQFGYVLGEFDAPVRVVAYVDTKCAECSQFTEDVLPELLPLIQEKTLQAELVFITDGSESAKMVGVAGLELGNVGFHWDFASLYLAHLARGGSTEPDEAQLLAIANSLPRAEGEETIDSLSGHDGHDHGTEEIDFLLQGVNERAAELGFDQTGFGLLLAQSQVMDSEEVFTDSPDGIDIEALKRAIEQLASESS